MAKDKSKKQATGGKTKKAGAGRPPKTKASSTQAAVKKAVRTTKASVKKLAANPAVAEIVAASLVAAAAAIKNPKKARDMAASVGNELSAGSKQSIDRGNKFWALALDVAQRSLEALGNDKAGKSKAPKKKTKK